MNIAPNPNPNPTPKTRFLQSKENVNAHREMVQSEAFQRGADVAMLQYAAYLNQTEVNGSEAAASHYKARGAQEFLATFRLLSEIPPRPTINDPDNLKETN